MINSEPATPEDDDGARYGRAPNIPGLDFVREVGSGGHSTVYLARQVDHDRQVAVKVLDAALDGTARRRFDRERATLGRVSTHPAVVGLFDSGITDDGRAYLVLEWAPGGSLEDHLAQVGTLGVNKATELGICLAGALEQAHRSGVMHRDIKPSNIVRSEFGDWLLTDFSVAAFSDPAIATDAIQVSLAHCPPEAFDRTDPSAAADVYSLGSVMRTALVGDAPNTPRPGETVTAAVGRITTIPLSAPDEEVTGAALSKLIGRMIDHEPDRRPTTMRTVANELADVRHEQHLSAITFRVGSDVTLPLATLDLDVQCALPARAALSAARPRSFAHPESRAGQRRPVQPRRSRRRQMFHRGLAGVALMLTLLVGGLTGLRTLQPSDVVAGLAIPAAAVAEPELATVEPVIEESSTEEPLAEGLDAENLEDIDTLTTDTVTTDTLTADGDDLDDGRGRGVGGDGEGGRNGNDNGNDARGGPPPDGAGGRRGPGGR